MNEWIIQVHLQTDQTKNSNKQTSPAFGPFDFWWQKRQEISIKLGESTIHPPQLLSTSHPASASLIDNANITTATEEIIFYFCSVGVGGIDLTLDGRCWPSAMNRSRSMRDTTPHTTTLFVMLPPSRYRCWLATTSAKCSLSNRADRSASVIVNGTWLCDFIVIISNISNCTYI